MSSMRGSTSRVYSVPLTVIVTSTSGLRAAGTGGGPAQGPGGELTGQVPLVVDRPALVSGGPAVLGRELAGPDERRVLGRLAPQELLGRLRHEVAGADRGQADARLGHRAR